MIDRFERFSHALSEISRHWHKLTADEMGKYGLKGTHAVYLMTLYRHTDGITAAALCDACGRDKADVSRMISIMEQKGLVTREGNAYRGRWKLTETGRHAAEFVRERASLAVTLAGQGLSDENRVIFYETLELIAANLRELSKDGLPHEASEKTSEGAL